MIDQHHHHRPLAKKLIHWTLCALLPIFLVRLYLYPSIPSSLPLQSPSKFDDPLLDPSNNNQPALKPISHSSIPPSQPQPQPQPQSQETEEAAKRIQYCDMSDGEWVRDESGPLYNGTSCATIKDGQNCIAHGRPDRGYLHWRWRPRQCALPRFDGAAFLRLLRNKHLAFVGDSMARNQLESLLCMLAAASAAPPDLVYRDGDDNKFRRWLFPSHNATVSVFWSPFLVRGVEKSAAENYNKLHLDAVDERWASELGSIDMVVLSVGHWFLHPAVYHEGGVALGCHYCPGLNHSEIGFYGAYRKAVRTAVKAVTSADRRGKGVDAVVATFSPAHFEGEWDKAGACPKTKPFREGERAVEGMDAEMRKVAVEEVAAARGGGEGLLEALDVTKLALMRPDGHPGPYMNFLPPFNPEDGRRMTERQQNDCVHWCLPGPVDTWNEILLQTMINRRLLINNHPATATATATN